MLQNSATGDVDVRNSHYFVIDAEEAIYLVNLDGTSRSYYLFTDFDTDDYVDGGELTEVAESHVPEYIIPESAATDLQNFANWFSYYRAGS